MKTPHLDQLIEELDRESVYTSFSDEDRERLKEFESIKHTLESLPNIKGAIRIKDLKPNQIKQLYCSAVGWHSSLEGEPTNEKFNEFYDKIEFEWDEDRWTIIGEMAQLEITEDLFFRCGMKYKHNGIGGTAFDLNSVYNCLISFILK